jgi:hypothetical protein
MSLVCTNPEQSDERQKSNADPLGAMASSLLIVHLIPRIGWSMECFSSPQN